MDGLPPFLQQVGAFVLGGICHGALHRIGAKIVEWISGRGDGDKKP